jgi:hypothetical protein
MKEVKLEASAEQAKILCIAFKKNGKKETKK